MRIPFGKEERRACVLPREVSWTTKSNIFKNSDGKVGRNKVYHEKSAEVVVGTVNTEGPNDCIVLITMSKHQTIRWRSKADIVLSAKLFKVEKFKLNEGEKAA